MKPFINYLILDLHPHPPKVQYHSLNSHLDLQPDVNSGQGILDFSLGALEDMGVVAQPPGTESVELVTLGVEI